MVTRKEALGSLCMLGILSTYSSWIAEHFRVFLQRKGQKNIKYIEGSPCQYCQSELRVALTCPMPMLVRHEQQHTYPYREWLGR